MCRSVKLQFDIPWGFVVKLKLDTPGFLFHQHELFLRGECGGFDHVQIHAARDLLTAIIFRIPHDAVMPGIHLARDELLHKLPAHVVDGQAHFTRFRQGKADRRARIERIRIILLQRIAIS